MIEGAPLPGTDDPIDQEFWAASARSELVVQQCASCGAMRFPPRPMCPKCQCETSRWLPVSGDGVIWSFAAPRSPLLPAFESLAPYVTAIVALSEREDLRIAALVVRDDEGNVSGVEPSDVKIGQRVRVQFKRYSDDCVMPCWRIVTP